MAWDGSIPCLTGRRSFDRWDAIAKLAAITGIRTFLNFFLQKEVQELQAMDQRILQQMHDLNAHANDESME